jgi:nitric oxide reductase NorD protein
MAGPTLDLDLEYGLFRAVRALWRRISPKAAAFDSARAATLAPLSRRLSVVASLVAGDPLRVVPADGAGGLRGDDLLLPRFIDLAPDPEANAGLYVLRAALAGALHAQGEAPAQTLDARVAAAAAALCEELPAFAGPWEAALAAQEAADRVVLWGPVLTPPEVVSSADGESEDGDAGARPESEAEIAALEEVVVHDLDEEEALQTPVHAFEKVEMAESFNGTMRQLDGEDDLDDHLEALEEVDLGDLLRGGPEAHSLLRADITMDADIPDVGKVGADEPHITYDEWSARKGRYLKDWCRVYPTPMPRGDEAWAQEVLHRQARTVERLYTELARHRDRLRAAPRQLDGEDVDTAAMVDAWATVRAGRSPSRRLYTRQRRQIRDVATLVLLDTSLSTDSWVDDRRVLDVARESVLVLGEVADRLGDALAVTAFASHTRHRVRAWQVRDWNEPWAVGRGRLGRLHPQGYTRIGPALRHGIATLAEVPAKRRLLLLVSDGKPTDYDRYEGRHGLADVRQALRESHQKGVRVHALTIDAEAREWLPAMLGPGGWDILRRPDDLPMALTRAYGRLA